jgi:hypothetical protein
VSNAPEVATETRGNQTVHRFAPTLPLPSYLVAVMAGPFVSVDGAVPATPQRAAPLPLRVISTKPNTGKLDFALDGTKGIVSHLENYFGQAFPFPKLDQITARSCRARWKTPGPISTRIAPRPRRQGLHRAEAQFRHGRGARTGSPVVWRHGQPGLVG